MMTNGQLGWRDLFLILTVLPCCCSIEVSIPEKEYIAQRGGEISLTCSFTPANPESQILFLAWEAFPDNIGGPLKPVATYYLNNPTDISPAYEGRVSLNVDLGSKVSTLQLTKVTMQDSRSYQCSVKIPGDDEGTSAVTTFLLVKVPPSAPICKLQGTAEYWHNISLTCMSEEGSPKPIYKWESYTVENKQRPFPPKAIQQDGVLSLFNISQDMSGYYICTSSNELGSASCNFTLAVMPSSMNIGSTGIIVVAVLAGVVVVGIIIFCFCRRKSKKNKYAKGSQGEMEFNDTDAPETEKRYWDDDTSNSLTKQQSQFEDKIAVPPNDYIVTTAGHMLEDDQHSSIGAKDSHVGKGSDINSQHYQGYRGSRDHLDDQRKYAGSRDRLDEQRDRYGGSRDRLDDQRDRYGGSRDRLEDQRDRCGGSRDRLDDQRDRYGGSRDRLDDHRDRYAESRDRLDDQRIRHGGSRDRLDDQRDRYGGSRDRLDDQRDRYGGSRDRLDDQRDRYGGSRDRLDDQRDRYGGSRDQLDNRKDRYGGSRDRLDHGDDQFRN